jgi:hypothetical protein
MSDTNRSQDCVCAVPMSPLFSELSAVGTISGCSSESDALPSGSIVITTHCHTHTHLLECIAATIGPERLECLAMAMANN